MSVREEFALARIHGKLAALDGVIPSGCPYVNKLYQWHWRLGFEEGIAEINRPSDEEMRIFLLLSGWSETAHRRWIHPDLSVSQTLAGAYEYQLLSPGEYK